MKLNEPSLLAFAQAVALFIEALEQLAVQRPDKAKNARYAKSVHERYLGELLAGLERKNEEEVVGALFSIHSSASPMDDMLDIDVDAPPLDAAWKQVKQSAAPILQVLAEEE